MSERDPMAPRIRKPLLGSYAEYDLSGLVNRYSMRSELVEREGNNGGLLRNGEQVKDVLARKLRLSWTLNSMPASQYATLTQFLTEDKVYAVVFDPCRNETRLIQCIVTLPAFEVAFVVNERPMTKAGAALVLEEV